MSFRCVGTTPNPARVAMRPPVTTNGNAVCAKSLVSNVRYVRTKLLLRSQTISLSGICGVQHQRVPPSSWVSIQCYLTEHATCWWLTLTEKIGVVTRWLMWKLAISCTSRAHWNVLVLGMGHMLGYSSKGQSPLRRRGASVPASSQIQWSGYPISVFGLTTGSFRARTRCRSAASAISLRCHSREQPAAMRTVFLLIGFSRLTPTNGDTLLAFDECLEKVSIVLLSMQVPEAECSASGYHWKRERTSRGFGRLLDVVRSRSSQEYYPPQFA